MEERTLSKAEKFIKNCTRNCSNEIGYCHNKTRNHNHVFFDWLTPNQARKAVEIAREEIYEWLINHNDYIIANGSITRFDMKKCVDDLRQAMKYE